MYGRRPVETQKKLKKPQKILGAGAILWLYTSIFLFVSLKILNMERTNSPGTRPGGKWALRGFLWAVEVVQRLDLVVEVYY